MKIGIIDADLLDHGTTHPNLALMKIAGYYLKMGNDVQLIYDSYDKINEYDHVYISKVFTYSKVPDWVMNKKNISYGGTGFFEDGGPNLPMEIEHHKPYYELYNEYINYMKTVKNSKKSYIDYLDFSIGFTTRGCFRKCDFCVNKKYNKVIRHSKVNEFLDAKRSKIYLWDDNILGYSKWEEIFDELEVTNKPFQFRQGLDLRLMTERKANRLNRVKYYGDIIFAFDDLKDSSIVISKLQLWKKYTNKLPKMYVLCAFKSIDEKDITNLFERIHILMKYGSLPYIMRYENYKLSKYSGIYIQVARWCNQPQFYKKMSFREFCERNQYYHLNLETLCSAYRVMLEFEEQHPSIAKKYFDLKYMNESYYSFNYGYGRKYKNKSECNLCITKKLDWKSVLKKSNKLDSLVRYYQKELDAACLCYKNSICEKKLDDVGEYLFELIYGVNVHIIVDIIKEYNNIEELTKKTAVLPNAGSDYYYKLLKKIFGRNYDFNVNIKDIITKFKVSKGSDVRQLMNDLRVLALMDIIILSKNEVRGVVSLSALGIVWLKKTVNKRKIVFRKNLYRLPLFQYYLIKEKDNIAMIEKFKELKLTRPKNIINNLESFN